MRTVKAEIDVKNKTEQEELIAPMIDFVIKALTLRPTSSVGWTASSNSTYTQVCFIRLAFASPTYEY